jgi:hypothetical protein
MIEWLLVCAVALVASAMTLFAGFGLGTMLLPAFALFFPLELAVAATAVVHLANNLIKVSLLGRHADRTVLRRFGLPAIIAAISGARLLTDLSGAEPLATWTLGARVCHVTPIGLMIGGLMAIFALWDLVPLHRNVGMRQYPLLHRGGKRDAVHGLGRAAGNPGLVGRPQHDAAQAPHFGLE